MSSFLESHKGRKPSLQTHMNHSFSEPPPIQSSHSSHRWKKKLQEQGGRGSSLIKKSLPNFYFPFLFQKHTTHNFVANVDLIDDCSKIIMFFDLSEEKSVPMFTQFAWLCWIYFRNSAWQCPTSSSTRRTPPCWPLPWPSSPTSGATWSWSHQRGTGYSSSNIWGGSFDNMSMQ